MGKAGHKLKFVTFAVGFALLLLVVLSGTIFYKLKYTSQPLIRSKISEGDINYLSDLYIYSSPNLDGRQFYGDPDASIRMVAYLNIGSNSSRYFIKEIFPDIKKKYIDAGIVKYYHKNYITAEDLEEKNDNFKYSKALLCLGKLKKESYYDFYFDLFSVNTGEIPELIQKHGVGLDGYSECIDKVEFDELYEDLSETENFGMLGLNQRFYIGITGRDNTILDGVPKYSKFEDTIRQYELVVGS